MTKGIQRKALAAKNLQRKAVAAKNLQKKAVAAKNLQKRPWQLRVLTSQDSSRSQVTNIIAQLKIAELNTQIVRMTSKR